MGSIDTRDDEGSGRRLERALGVVLLVGGVALAVVVGLWLAWLL